MRAILSAARRSRAARTGVWAALAGLLAVLVVTVLVPRLAGASTYTVLTGSMRPDLGPGTLLVVRPTDPGDIDVGSVITYQLRSGEPEVVTHRVVTVAHADDGSPVFQTQGDANDSPDEHWVKPVQLRGEVWYSVPFVGHVNQVLSPDRRAQLAVLAALVLLAYAVVMFTLAVRDWLPRRFRVRHG